MEPNRRHRTICITVSATVLGIVLVAIILSLSVIFKVKSPSTKVNSISPRNITVDLDLAHQQLHLNLMLGIDISLKNPIRASFEYANSLATLSYQGEAVGKAPIPAREVSPGETKWMELALTVMAAQGLFPNSAVIGDVVAGRMVFSSYTRLSGKVRFFGAIKLPGEQSCKYKTEL